MIRPESFAQLLERRRCSVRELARRVGISVARLYQVRDGDVLRDDAAARRLAGELRIGIVKLRAAMNANHETKARTEAVPHDEPRRPAAGPRGSSERLERGAGAAAGGDCRRRSGTDAGDPGSAGAGDGDARGEAAEGPGPHA